jgi:predicted DCC family thiol-disulfide oxidoreductase YuxK
MHPILLFDGVCNLCNASVQWVLLHDKKGVFRFAAQQSEAGQELLKRYGRHTSTLDSVVLVDGDRIYIQSDAAIEVAVRLGGIWRLMGIFKIVPKVVRNGIYDWIARNRFRWFGKREQCMLPRPEWKERFL